MIEQLLKETFHSYSAAQRNLILNEINADKEIGKLWVEKIRRYVSLHGSNILKIAKVSFSGDHVTHFSWMIRCLQSGLKNKPNDQALINALLYLSRYTNSSQRNQIANSCMKLEKWLLKTQPIQLSQDCDKPSFKSMKIQILEELGENRIVIISPSPFSLYTLTVYQILKLLNVPIAAIVLRRFTMARFKDEFSRDGLRLVKKIWRKLILRSNENSDKGKVSLKYIAERLRIENKDIRKLAGLDGVKCIEVNDFIDENEHVKSLDADIGIFTGGGMISETFLSKFSAGVINTHMGGLPRFKGMDVVEAPILEGNFNEIALTSHIMVKALDAGPILQEFKISSQNYGALGSLRNELSAVMPFIAVDSCIGLLAGRLKKIEQPRTGRQYYFIHARLQKVLKNVLQKRFVRSHISIPKEICERALYDLQL